MTDPAGGSPGRGVQIVIPAHDEAAVIGRCLRGVLQGAEQGEFDILVVSNGSSDGTAEIARCESQRLGFGVEVTEIATASKLAALRAAEERLRTAPGAVRIYVDADVVVSTGALRLLREAVAGDDARLALLTPDIDTSASSVFVRMYYLAWAVLARARGQGSGAGVLAMNAAGAERVNAWPEVINDDGFVVRQFSSAEKVFVPATARVLAVRSLRDLVRRRARVVNGNRQLDARWPLPPGESGAGVRLGEVRAAVAKREVSWLQAVVYVGVTVAARLLAAWRRKRGSAADWSRDSGSRQLSTGEGS